MQPAEVVYKVNAETEPQAAMCGKFTDVCCVVAWFRVSGKRGLREIT